MNKIRNIFSATFVLFGLLILSPLTGWAQTEPSILVNKNGLVINGTVVKLPVVSAELFKILGSPDRNTDGARRVWTWDRLGLLAYQKLESEDIVEIDIIFNTKESELNRFDFSPTASFNGKLEVDGASIISTSTVKSVNLKKSGSKFKMILPNVPMISEANSGRFHMVLLQKPVKRLSDPTKILQLAISSKEEK